MKVILPVPYHKQVLANSCFPACVRMVLEYYGDRIDEKALYHKALLPGHKGSWDVNIAQILIKKGYSVMTLWKGPTKEWKLPDVTLKHYMIESRKATKLGMKHKSNPTFGLIRKLIRQGIPVLAEVSVEKLYGKKINCTHMIVLAGYGRNNFYVHDPDKEFGAKFRRIAATRFKKGWEKITPSGYGRSVFVIKPKGHVVAKLL